ncbi:MAG: C25 family cysteine peptidase [Paludibacteraceae bacterium]|nr:C25 family cysteine peptidase [Paludibacteraceae bacterium]
MTRTKLFFVAICLLLLAPLKGWCDITVTPSNGITITITDSSYVIDYVGMDYMEQLDTLYSGEVFSKIVFPADYFGLYRELDDIGRPTLPIRPLELQLPDDARNIRVECLIYDRGSDYQTGIYLQKPYYPYQDGFEGTEIVVQYDSVYYATTGDGWYDHWYDISEVYNIYGTKGIHFGIVPVCYTPRHRAMNTIFEHNLRIASHIKYTIKFDGTTSLLDMMQDYLMGSYSEDALLYYDNYEGLGFEQTAMYKGRYAILTSPEFVDILQPFVDYKTHMGYDVEVYPNDYASLGASGTRSFLKGLYDDQRTRPRFVLLVGDDTKIPMSAGTWETRSDPPTDIFYACLNYTNADQEDRYLTPSVHLGRWPVTLESDITNIVNKTITTELGLADELRTNLYTQAFSSVGNDYNHDGQPNALESWQFYNAIKKIETKIYQQLSYPFVLTDGRSQPNPSHIISDRLERNTWMFIYRGHGDFTKLCNPYDFGYEQIQELHQNEISYFPLSFAFTCKTGGHILGSSYFYSYARYLLTKFSSGAVSHFGASVVSFTNANNNLGFNVFSQLLDQKNKTITSMTIDGASKYFLSCRTEYKRRQVKKYNFFGDPSLYILGLDRLTGNPRNRSVEANVSEIAKIHPTVTSNEIHIVSSNGFNVISITIYNTSGIIVLKSTANQMDVSFLPDGLYFAVLKSDNNQHIVEKFVIQH